MDSSNPTDRVELRPYTLFIVCFLSFHHFLHIYSMLSYIPLSLEAQACKHIFTSICCKRTLCIFSLSLRRCRARAWLCRVNVNVLTPLPKIRGVPALLCPLNCDPFFIPTSVLATSVLLAVGYLVLSEDLFAGGLGACRILVVGFLYLWLRVYSHANSSLRLYLGQPWMYYENWIMEPKPNTWTIGTASPLCGP